MTDLATVKCPKCGSKQIHAGKRGWSLLAGFIGSRKIVITCLACGQSFRPGDNLRPKRNPEVEGKAILIVIAIVYLVWAVMYGLSYLDAAIRQLIR